MRLLFCHNEEICSILYNILDSNDDHQLSAPVKAELIAIMRMS